MEYTAQGTKGDIGMDFKARIYYQEGEIGEDREM